MDEWFEQLLRHQDSTTVKSQAMKPLVWLCGGVFAVGAACLLRGGATAPFGAALIVGAVIAFLWWYNYWAKNDPDRLGSERFVTTQRAFELIQSKGEAPALIASSQIEEIAEPLVPPLPGATSAQPSAEKGGTE